ncbi:hypothetical protein AJ79_02245 [Helicocarpus griseus UAMH5409]|uniref:Uncharacterized protein n=1 Tax=Helicocarpus griseus UAMH5409 TaxID=1447875 RepID=A0A2B7Y3N0_9EURO|nr:hypothetical protein AJ79_02245 [Helicocarpus griseus UAMH5409]
MNGTVRTHKTVTVVQTNSTLVFQSRYSYLAGALVVMLLAFLAVSTTYYGWWQLVRNMTLSPIEVARAFNAALLRGTPSNMQVSILLAEVGKTRVRYGEIFEEDIKDGDGVKTGNNIGDGEHDQGARAGMMESNGLSPDGQKECWLGFDKADSVQPPEKGKIY